MALRHMPYGPPLQIKSAPSNPPPSAGDTVARIAEFVPTHRHKKRGSEYRKIGTARVQTDTPLNDYDSVVVYQHKDGEYWVRPVSEFEDGRFEALSPSPASAEGK